MADRKSEAEVPILIEDPHDLAQREAENAVLQYDWAMEEVARWLKDDNSKFRVSMLLTLHRKAMDGIDPYAGNFRPAGVAIKGSKHEPVSGEDVARYVEEMLDYISVNWQKSTAVHLSSYAMWRLNWIHPFSDGNGRTSRMLSYMVLCARLEQVLPGTRTIPEQISENKDPYYRALEKADHAFKSGSVDVSEMERLMENYLANQLVEIHEKAVGSEVRKDALHEPAMQKKGMVALIEAHPVIVTSIVAIVIAIVTIFLSA
ncbi:Fic family protein [Thalassococcus lentus]|uniref:Fic family protein n=1 Tax=Thalassococcus lentus TaxID=1210524 RepID=A0ABT4XPH2_9RHOB|nr:Fic family protein [Thalassococcus lentus]MDA7423797.1 Fic family protein [Thalassococcus lentus]